jgi:hypothetical protein
MSVWIESPDIELLDSYDQPQTFWQRVLSYFYRLLKIESKK